MRKNLLLFVALASCFLFQGCLDLILTINRTHIPDALEGVWKIDDETYEVRKKDDYWANVTILSEGDKDKKLGMTLHKINGSLFACFSAWDEQGKKRGSVLPIEIISDQKVHFYKFDIDFKLSASFSEMTEDQKETLFLSYLKNGKLGVDKSEEHTAVLKKASSLDNKD
jgi:hypothetical protein